MCVFIKLHITVQSNPALPFQSFYTVNNCITPLLMRITKTSDLTRRRDTHSLSTFVQLLHLSPERLALPSLPPFYSLDFLGRHLLSQHFLVYDFFSFRSSLLRFPHPVHHSTLLGFLVLLRLFFTLRDPWSSCMSFASRPLALVLRKIRPSCWGVGPCGCGCWLLIRVAPSANLHHLLCVPILFLYVYLCVSMCVCVIF